VQFGLKPTHRRLPDRPSVAGRASARGAEFAGVWGGV